MKVAFSIFFSVLLIGFSTSAAAKNCYATCSGSTDVVVDLQKRCMCLKGANIQSGLKCFQIDIGKSGPNMTTSGKGKLKKAEGDKYSTTPGPGTRSYDKDAIDMGIPENSNVGKWIHKTSKCSGGGRQATKGCVAVPCEHWPDVKAFLGKGNDGAGGTLEVCGSSKQSRGSGSGAGGGSSDTSR